MSSGLRSAARPLSFSRVALMRIRRNLLPRSCANRLPSEFFSQNAGTIPFAGRFDSTYPNLSLLGESDGQAGEGDSRSQRGHVNQQGGFVESRRKNTGVPGNTEDAISLLKAGHAKVKQLFDSYKTRTRRADRARLVQKHVRLSPFMLFWMEIFHPVCRELIDDDSLDEAQVEHDSAKVLISELLAGSPEDPFYDAKFEVLADQIRHHIQEEEGDSDSIFAKARSAGADLVIFRAKAEGAQGSISAHRARNASTSSRVLSPKCRAKSSDVKIILSPMTQAPRNMFNFNSYLGVAREENGEGAQAKNSRQRPDFNGAPERIRTSDPQIRSL